MKMYLITLGVMAFLLSSCATLEPIKKSEYDGHWEGELACGPFGLAEYNPDLTGSKIYRDVILTIEDLKISSFLFDFSKMDEGELQFLPGSFPKDYFVDETTVSLDVNGKVKPNRKVYINSTYEDFSMGVFPKAMSLFGELVENKLEFSGLINDAPCKLSVIKSQSLPMMALSKGADPRALQVGNLKGFGDYHALVIGINDYNGLPNLKSAVYDAEAIKDTLQSGYGFKTQLMVNPTRSEIIKSLGDYRKNLKPTDNFLVYYAGHGWLDEQADQGYWLPSDAQKDDESNWLSNGTLTASLRAIPAKHVMVISDSCYSGKLTRGLKMTKRNSNYLNRLIKKKARTVMTSGGLEPVLDKGGKDNHSVFASALLDALTKNDGVMEGNELFSRVRRPVALNSEQTPEYGDIHKAGHDGGDFLFVRNNMQKNQ